MRFGYVVRPQADRDIDDIADYLAEEAGLDMALQFLAEVYETFGLLASEQQMGWHCKVRHPQLLTLARFVSVLDSKTPDLLSALF